MATVNCDLAKVCCAMTCCAVPCCAYWPAGSEELGDMKYDTMVTVRCDIYKVCCARLCCARLCYALLPKDLLSKGSLRCQVYKQDNAITNLEQLC